MNESASGYRCERASTQHLSALLALFERAGSGCYCQYWHFNGDKNAWLERCYVNPEKNREALAAQLASNDLYGVVAKRPHNDSASEVAGWLKVTRAQNVGRIYEQRVYRNLPCFGEIPRDDVFTIGCLYVAEAERGAGVASALLQAAIAAARSAGASALEAFPRKAPPQGDAPLRSDEVWMGPEALYEHAGFRAVSDFRPYPVLRLQLR